jgi:hypothetical protein
MIWGFLIQQITGVFMELSDHPNSGMEHTEARHCTGCQQYQDINNPKKNGSHYLIKAK